MNTPDIKINETASYGSIYLSDISSVYISFHSDAHAIYIIARDRSGKGSMITLNTVIERRVKYKIEDPDLLLKKTEPVTVTTHGEEVPA